MYATAVLASHKRQLLERSRPQNPMNLFVGVVREENSKIKEMKVTEISLYNPDKEKDPFALLRKAGAGKYFEKIDAIKYTQAIR